MDVIRYIDQEAARALGPALTERPDPQPSCLTSTDAVDRCFFAAYYREATKGRRGLGRRVRQ